MKSGLIFVNANVVCKCCKYLDLAIITCYMVANILSFRYFSISIVFVVIIGVHTLRWLSNGSHTNVFCEQVRSNIDHDDLLNDNMQEIVW